jgi:hypothetical protein
MGQVPQVVGLIGRGRVAKHFIHYFNGLGVQVLQWTRNTSTPLHEKLKDCTVIGLAVSDNAILSLYSESDFLKSKNCFHFSGSLSLPQIPSSHPLMTFADDLYDLPTYEKMVFIEETQRPVLQKFLPFLKNTTYSISPQHKALYHALCTLASTGTNVIWSSIFEIFEKEFYLPKQAAVPFMEKLMQNSVTLGAKGLTGPLQRKDLETTQKHMQSLEKTDLQLLYVALADKLGMRI